MASSGAAAQEAVAEQEAEAALAGDIVVTAQRRAELLHDVPMSVAVISGQAMENAGAVSLRELGQVASGVLVANAGYNTQPSIRGVTTILGGNFYENNVAVYIDGVYQPDPIAINSDLVNLADVQVLKGPQGTLYGRNATGGAILINTLAPARSFTGSFQGSYAEYDEKTLSGYLSGPISERVRFGVAGYWRKSDGYFKLSDPATGAKTGLNAAPIEKYYVRAKLAADLTDTFEATLGYNYSYFNDATALQYLPFENFAPTFPAPPTRSPTPLKTKSANFIPVNESRIHEATLKLDWSTPLGDLTSVTAYTRSKLKNDFDLDGTYARLSRLATLFPRETIQTNLNYAIDAIDRLDLVVGGSYYGNRVWTTYFNSYGPNDTVSALIDQATKQRAFALYADGTYQLTDKLSLSLGLGYSHEKSEINYSLRTPAQIGTGAYTIAPLHKEASFEKLTPRASLRYEIAARTNIYAAYSQGFKAGLWQTGIPPAVPVRPESVTSYEVGFKTAQSDFQLDVAGFYYDYTNIQLSITVPDPLCTTPPNCVIRTLVFNGPSADIYGIDAQGSWSPTSNFTLRAGAAWLRARYGTFPNATGTGLNTTSNTLVPNQSQDWSGQQLPRAPDFSGFVGADLKFPTPRGEFLLSLNVPFTTSYVVNNPSLFGPLAGPRADKQRYRQSGYAQINATLNWTDPSDRLSVGIFARNLTNERYFILYSSSGAFGDYAVTANPRVIGARAGYKF